MTADKEKIARDCWKKGTDASHKMEWDYAIEMYGKAVQFVPENLIFRQSLRGSECRKYKNNKSGAKLAKMKLLKIRTKLANARRKEDWKAIDRIAEEGLTVNPWDGGLNAALGEACDYLGYKEVAIFSHRNAVSAKPDYIPYHVSLANLLEERGEYNEAINVWRRIIEINPDFPEARSKIKQLDAMHTIDRGGYDDAKSTLDVKTGYDYDGPDTSRKGSQPDRSEMSVEDGLKRAIRKNQTDKDNYIKLANFYRKEKRLDEATKTLQEALEVSGGDHSIKELLADVQLEMLEHNLDLAKQNAADNPDDENAPRMAAELAKELLRREIDVFTRRVERYPNDSKIKFQLAKRLMRAARFPEAIQFLQQAGADARLECDVLVLLGECFLREDNTVLARKQFERAAGKVNPIDQADLYKKTHYTLGRMCEEAGQTAQAIDHYNEVLSLDYGYRDTRERLDSL